MAPQHQADNKQLQDKLDSMGGQVKRLQAQADREERSGPRGGVRARASGDVWHDVRDTREDYSNNHHNGKGGNSGGKGKKQKFGQWVGTANGSKKQRAGGKR